MANEIREKPIASAAFTITLASLATATGRQSDMIDNTSNYPAALVFLKLRSGAVAPTAGSTYDVYLLRGDDATPNIRTDMAGASDAAITIENATLLGSIQVTASTAKDFAAEFDTWKHGPLGPEWGIAVVNRTGQTMDSTEGNHLKRYVYHLPEVQ